MMSLKACSGLRAHTDTQHSPGIVLQLSNTASEPGRDNAVLKTVTGVEGVLHLTTSD